MRRPGLLVAAAVLAAVAGCGGGSTPTGHAAGLPDEGTPSASTGGQAPRVAHQPTPSGSVGGPTAAPGARRHGAATHRLTPRTAAGRHPAPAQGQRTSGTPRQTAPGGYTYDVSGTSGGKRSSGTQALTVTQLTTTEQRQRTTGNDVDTSIVLRYGSTSVDLAELKLSGQFNKDFRPRPPVVQLPLPLQVGRHWSYDLVSTDRSTTIHGDFSTPGTSSAAVGGQQLSCVYVAAHLVFHLTYNGQTFTVTDDDTQCLSVRYGLALRIHDALNAGLFGKSDSTATLRSVQPH